MIFNLCHNLLESMRQPGVLSLVGRRREKVCTRDLKSYFRVLGDQFDRERLSSVADADTQELALHAAEMRIMRAVRLLQPILLQVLSTNCYLAILEGWKVAQFSEAVGDVLPPGLPGFPPPPPPPEKKPPPYISFTSQLGQLDKLGLSGQEAAAWAALHSSELVAGIDQTTRELMQKAIQQGIEERLGVPGLGRLIRTTVEDMSTYRAQTIASTEMNAAFSEASMRKMQRLGVEYKQWILAPDACPICEDNAADNPLPIDESFSSGDAAPPAHPNCRCSIVPARAPDEYEAPTPRAPAAHRPTEGTSTRIQ